MVDAYAHPGQAPAQLSNTQMLNRALDGWKQAMESGDERVNVCETNLSMCKRKFDYLRDQFDRLLPDLREFKRMSEKEKADLQDAIRSKQDKIEELTKQVRLTDHYRKQIADVKEEKRILVLNLETLKRLNPQDNGVGRKLKDDVRAILNPLKAHK